MPMVALNGIVPSGVSKRVPPGANIAKMVKKSLDRGYTHTQAGTAV